MFTHTQYIYIHDFASDFNRLTDASFRDTTLGNLIEWKAKFEMIDIEHFSELAKTTIPLHSQEIRVCSIDTIHSIFQLATEEMKVKVKAIIEFSQGKVSIILFDFCIESNRDTSKSQYDTPFEDAISFSEVC